MSEADVRCDESKSFGNADPIFYQGLANIFHQTIELLRIPGVVEEVWEIISGCHRVHCLANLLQFPGNPMSDSALDLWECVLTVLVFSPSLSP